MAPLATELNAEITQKIQNSVRVIRDEGADKKEAGKTSAFSIRLGEGASLSFKPPAKVDEMVLSHPDDPSLGLAARAQFGKITPESDGSFSRTLTTFNAANKPLDEAKFKFDSKGQFVEVQLTKENGEKIDRTLKNPDYRSAPTPAPVEQRTGTQVLPAGQKTSAAPHVEEMVVQMLESELGSKFVATKTPEGQKFQRDRALRSAELPVVSRFMDGKASVGTVDPVNEFLKSKGFSIRLEPIEKGEVAAAATMNITTRWEQKGTSAKIQLDNGNYVPGAILPAGTVEKVFTTRQGQQVFKLGTSDEGVKLFAAKVGNGAKGDVEAYVETLRSEVSKSQGETPTGGLHIPKADFTRSGDLNGVKGMYTPDREHVISQAKFEHQFKLNENGTSAKAAAAAATSRGFSMPPKADYQIKGDYVVWVEVEGKQAFSARISEKEMKDSKIDF